MYRHAFQQPFQLEFTISLGEGEEEEFTEPVTLVEVNGRTSFEIRGEISIPQRSIIIHRVCRSKEWQHLTREQTLSQYCIWGEKHFKCSKTQCVVLQWIIDHVCGTKFQGPELFHFEARVDTSSSFCNLTTYFIVSWHHVNKTNGSLLLFTKLAHTYAYFPSLITHIARSLLCMATDVCYFRSMLIEFLWWELQNTASLWSALSFLEPWLSACTSSTTINKTYHYHDCTS